MATLNAAWQAAATEMYQASGNPEAGPQDGGTGGEAKAGGGSANDVSDVEFEEVNDNNKK